MNRSTPLRSRSSLRRTKRINPKRRAPRRSGRERDRAYLLKVKGLPCILAPRLRVVATESWQDQRKATMLTSFLCGVLTTCEGPIEADHAGRRPLGRKCSDHEAIPLCRKHHRERTDAAGYFRGWIASLMRVWLDLAIASTQATLGYERRAA